MPGSGSGLVVALGSGCISTVVVAHNHTEGVVEVAGPDGRMLAVRCPRVSDRAVKPETDGCSDPARSIDVSDRAMKPGIDGCTDPARSIEGSNRAVKPETDGCTDPAREADFPDSGSIIHVTCASVAKKSAVAVAVAVAVAAAVIASSSLECASNGAVAVCVRCEAAAVWSTGCPMTGDIHSDEGVTNEDVYWDNVVCVANMSEASACDIDDPLADSVAADLRACMLALNTLWSTEGVLADK